MGANSPTSCKVLTCLLNATWSRLIWLKLFSTCLQEHRLAETCQLVHARYISGPSKLPKTQCCASNRIWKRSTYQTAKLEGVRMTANTKCKPATVNSRIQHKHRHTNALYLNQLNSLVTSCHQPRFWRHIFKAQRVFCASPQAKPTQETHKLPDHLPPFRRGRGRELRTWSPVLKKAMCSCSSTETFGTDYTHAANPWLCSPHRRDP